MRFVEAHLLTDMIEGVQKLVMMGMEAAVVPRPHASRQPRRRRWASRSTFRSRPVLLRDRQERREVPPEAARLVETRTGGGDGRGPPAPHLAPRHRRGVSAPGDTPSLRAAAFENVRR